MSKATFLQPGTSAMGDQKLYDERFKQYRDLDQEEINKAGADDILYGNRFTAMEMPKTE